jgi:hypothetical protein
MKQEWIDTLRQMRAQGYAVIVWTPDELKDTSPEWVEDCSISYGNEYLIDHEEVKQ